MIEEDDEFDSASNIKSKNAADLKLINNNNNNINNNNNNINNNINFD